MIDLVNIPETDLKVGDRVFSIGSPRIFIGTVTRVMSTIVFSVDQSGQESGYAIRSDRMILVERDKKEENDRP